MQLSATTLSEAVAAFLEAGHGDKTAVAERFALAWQCSTQTVYRRVAPELRQLTGRGRKRRSDAGESAWTMIELETVAADRKSVV